MTCHPAHAVRWLAAFATVAAVLVSCARNPGPVADSEVVVATVDGAPITLQDLKTEIAGIRGVAPSVAARSGTRVEVSRSLRNLVERAVVLREGERLGVAVTGSEVEEEIRRYRSDFPPGGLEKALLQEGIDEKEWREGLRRSILYRKSADAIAAPLAVVSEEEVKKEFRDRYGSETRPEQIRVRQLLFDSPEAAARAREKLAGGSSPEDVVKRESAGDTSPADIDLGYLGREEFPEGVASELFGLPAGGVSGVIRRDNAFSLFLVIEKRSPRAVSLAEMAPEIRKEMLRKRRESAFRAWLEAEVGKADIKVQEAILKELAEGGK